MATKPKIQAKDARTQRQKFIDAAKEHGADGDAETFRKAVKRVATALVDKAKKSR